MTPSFSQRKGLKPIKSVLQIDSMDGDLRNGLWNDLTRAYWEQAGLTHYPMGAYLNSSDTKTAALVRSLWADYFKQPLHDLPRKWDDLLFLISSHFDGFRWHEVYDFIEFVANAYPDHQVNANFMEACNRTLEREMSAYRFVSGRITEITSETEIDEIEEAINHSNGPMQAVSEHLRTALNLLADRDNPDYRNSIKESISAVEGMCKLLAGSKGAMLTEALRAIKPKLELHPALESALIKLYGYTGDAEGIRHALMEASNLGFEDAKFMLVSCSAFVNYLKAKAGKAGVEV
jgi:hypothetical protein